MASSKKNKASKKPNTAATPAPGQEEAKATAAPKPVKSDKGSKTGDQKGKDTKAKDTKSKSAKTVTKKPGILKRIAEYFHNVRQEIKRTTWPTKNEVLNMTLVVIAALIFFGVLIFILDAIMTQLLFLYGSLTGSGAGADVPTGGA